MVYRRTDFLKRITAAVFAIMMLVSLVAASGCSKDKPIKVPDGLTREEAALYVALAATCPKDKNSSKAKYLTFRFEGWSFGQQVPDAINEYLADYCKAGDATLMQFDDEWLKQIGLLSKVDDPDEYYGGQTVYRDHEGNLGAIFTFTLGDDQNVESDNMLVSFQKFISDDDTHGYDIELKYEKGSWKHVQNTNPWSRPQLFTPAPTDEDDPQK